MFKLETERLYVREWEPQDREAFRAMAQDPLVMRYINNGIPMTDGEVDAALARQARQVTEFGFCMGALIERETGEVVGTVGLQPLGTTGDLEIGWWVRPDRWGRGYATEGGAAAVKYIFEILERDRLFAIIDPPNNASKRVAAHLGLEYQRTVTGAELGHRRPEIVVDLFRLDRDSATVA